jgi:gliding motility-associated-like protein
LVQPTEIPMCAPSDIIEFEVYNADDGVAFGTIASVKLPPGLQIVPGSSRLSYPAGVAYVPLGNPTGLPGNVWQWDPATVSNTLATNGLAGSDNDPNNAFRIRFQVQAVCGFVSNSQIVYGTEAVRSCGALSNILRKPGEPLQLSGLDANYAVQANLAYVNPPGSINCAESTELIATITMGDAPSANDSLYILLPTGTSLVAGSYQPGPNAPAGPPQQNGQQLRLPLPGTLGLGSTFTFKFKLQYDDPSGCDDKIVVLQTREQETVFCPTTNSNCSVYVATGETFLTLNAQNPILRLNNFTAQQTGGTAGLTFNAFLENIGNGTAVNPNIRFYLDQNGNNQVDATDILVSTYIPTLNLTPNSSEPITGLLNLTPADLCRLIAFIPAMDNCACTDQTIPLDGNTSITYTIGKCTVSPVTLGIDNVAGHTYTWLTTNGLSCTDCATTTFTPGINVVTGEVVTLVLQDQTAGGCTIEHRFEVKFGGLNNIQLPIQEICEGETAILAAPPGGTYNWTGPGITNPAAQIQYVSPSINSNYAVTVTFADGCSGTRTTTISVLQADTIFSADRFTCKGSPVNMFGTLTDAPGLYYGEVDLPNSCKAIEVQRLVVTEVNYNETIPLCPGDSVFVLDSLFTGSGFICGDTIVGSCLGTRCVTVTSVVAPQLPVLPPYIIEEGGQTVIDIPNDFATYTWSPNVGLACSDCPDPTASPEKSTDYFLKILDGNGCQDTATYRVIVFPPCQPTRLEVPNVFTPNDGDNVNSVFRVVKFEGLETVVSLTVYNRWGQKIWVGNSATAAWDGTIDGQLAPSDVYVWVLVAACNGNPEQIKGEVTLLR